MSTVPQMTLDQYLQSARETADPKLLLDLIVAENERLKNESVLWQQDYREATEVTLDENLNFKPKTLAQLQRLARMYAESGYVPKHYERNIANTAIAVQMALRCRVDIMTFLQSSYIVHGKPGIEGKLVIAMLNCSDQISGRVRFEFSGEGKTRACRAVATDSQTGQELSQIVNWAMVEAEGWDKNAKWKTLTDLMLCYRSAVFLARVHFPDVLMGMRTLDELEDMTTTPVGVSSMEELSQRITQVPEPPAPSGNGAKPSKRAGRPRKSEPDGGDQPGPAVPPEAAKSSQQDVSEPATAGAPAAQASPASPTPATSTPPRAAAASPQELDKIIAFMRARYVQLCDGFDLELIAEAAQASPNWSLFCKSIIEKTKPGWEHYLAENQEISGDEIPGEEISQDDGSESVNQEVPDSVSNPVGRPPKADPVVGTMEKQVMVYKQAKRIRDFAQSQVRNNPNLTQDEQDYLLSLCDRRAWQLEQGTPYENLLKERQISETPF